MMFFSFRAILAIILTLTVASFAIPILEERALLDISNVVEQINTLTEAVKKGDNDLGSGTTKTTENTITIRTTGTTVTAEPISASALSQIVGLLQGVLSTLTGITTSVVGGTAGDLTTDQITTLTTAIQGFSTAFQALLTTVTAAVTVTATGVVDTTALQAVFAAIQVQINLLLSALSNIAGQSTLIANEEAALTAALQNIVNAL